MNRKINVYIQWGKKLFHPLLILYVCPLTKKWSVYNFNGRFILTVGDRITTKKIQKKKIKMSYKLICILISEINIDPFAKHNLVLGAETLVGNHRGQTFLVVGHQVCTHLRRDFVPLLFADPLQVIKVSRLTFGNSNLQLSPKIFHVIEVWRLARPLQDLNVLLLEPLLCCLGRVFWVIVMLEYPSTTHFQCPVWLQCPGPDSSMPCPLSRKTPQSIMFPPPCLTVGMVFLGS